MTTERSAGPSRRAILVGVGAALVLLGVAAWALGLGRPGPTAATTPAVPTATSGTPSASGSGSPSATTPAPTPTATETRSPYCVQFQRILDSGSESAGNEEELDLKGLSAKYGSLITLYSGAAKVAPASLKDDYARVLSFLKEAKTTIDDGDLQKITQIIKRLGTLNAAMDEIQRQSQSLCQ